MKTLWINGDSHTAGSHKPQQITNTFAKQVADVLHLEYINHSLPGGSNHRIIRTTIEALPDLDPTNTFILIGWSSCERTEWYWQDKWHAVCGDPGYEIPAFVQSHWHWHCHHQQHQFSDPASNYDLWYKSKEQEHAIFVFHKLLHNLGYKFLFFMACDNYFRFNIDPDMITANSKLPWLPGAWAQDPYASGFSDFCQAKGYQKDAEWHYGQDAHDAYAQFLLPLISQKIP